MCPYSPWTESSPCILTNAFLMIRAPILPPHDAHLTVHTHQIRNRNSFLAIRKLAFITMHNAMTYRGSRMVICPHTDGFSLSHWATQLSDYLYSVYSICHTNQYIDDHIERGAKDPYDSFALLHAALSKNATRDDTDRYTLGSGPAALNAEAVSPRWLHIYFSIVYCSQILYQRITGMVYCVYSPSVLVTEDTAIHNQ